jgi:hypothetical protein
VNRQDALDAVIQLAAVVDEAVQAAAIPVDHGIHAAAMLMVLREFVQPLPPDWDGDDGTDYLVDDLAMTVTALRRPGRPPGTKANPTLREIGEAVGLAPSSVHYRLSVLQGAGYLTRGAGRPWRQAAQQALARLDQLDY